MIPGQLFSFQFSYSKYLNLFSITCTSHNILPTEAQVDEDASPDSPVVAIRVTDADDDEAGRVTCEMDSENGMEYFKLVHNDDIVDMWYVFRSSFVF